VRLRPVAVILLLLLLLLLLLRVQGARQPLERR